MTDTLQEHKLDSGFSIIELIVVVLIIGVVSAIAIPVFSGAQSNAHDTAVKADLTTFKTLRDAANFTNGGLAGRVGSGPNLQALDFKPSLDAYDTTSTDHNLVLCSSSSDPQRWGLMALSKSGNAFYIADDVHSVQDLGQGQWGEDQQTDLCDERSDDFTGSNFRAGQESLTSGEIGCSDNSSLMPTSVISFCKR